MGINGIENSQWDVLFQGQNATANGTWGTDQGDATDLTSKLTQWLERRLDKVDKQLQQGQASGQLSSDEVQKLQGMEKDIKDKLKSLQQGQDEVSTQDLKDLRQMMTQLNDELRKAMPAGHHHHGAEALNAPSGSQTTVGLSSTDGDGQTQSVNVYA